MTKYLLDSNCFIEPMKRYYGFKIFPSFWEWFGKEINKTNSLLIVPKCVSNEINVDPNLAQWSQKNLVSVIYDENQDPLIWAEYGKVIKYIQDCGAYKSSSINEWKKIGKADPLLIAIAIKYNYQIVTFEKGSGQFAYDKNNRWNWKGNGGPMGHEPKIPDIARHFGITCLSLFELEKKLNLTI
ncbi:DUF4411 family protein [Lactobacillus johnsonii]|uniref:DUF4411 family protein n=1 Tax=Lactobacillus johnsonii TaxID=33959 RepID=UPI0021A769C0|nr:DUF4411 family protein [Lactobacillus johnsonii]MCT3321774.1 DUF4411 family protein [Lactobacillus johnsonii]